MKQIEFECDGAWYWANVEVEYEYKTCSDDRGGHSYAEVKDFEILDLVDIEGDDVEETVELREAVRKELTEVVCI